MSEAFLAIRDLGVRFPLRDAPFFRRSYFYALRHVSLAIRKEDTFCLVGESGSGKSTLVWALLGLHPFQEGRIIFRGETVRLSRDAVHQNLRARSQPVFQNPFSSLSPFLSLRASIEEPMKARKIGKVQRDRTIRELAEQINLSEAVLKRKPFQVSGGQNQRACIARALSVRPAILFLDEPLTALDALIRRQIADLLIRVRAEYGLTYFLISHDFRLVRRIGTQVAVMYLGRIVEKAPRDAFFSHPCHPYSQALLSGVSGKGMWSGKRIILKGEIPSLRRPPEGCVFHPRCFCRLPECEKIAPPPKKVGRGHEVFCHRC